MDVLFINSQSFSNSSRVNLPNLGLLNLSTILKKSGFSVEIFDFSYEKMKGRVAFSEDYQLFTKDIIDLMLAYNPRIIGFTTMCDSYPFTIDISRKIKLRNKQIKIIFGGPQASLTGAKTMEAYEFIDLIAIGEFENHIVNVVDALLSTASIDSKLSKIPNILYRANGILHTNPVNTQLVDLDTLPEIDSFFTLKYVDGITAYNVDAGRGCPYSCTFCCTSKFWNRNFRMKPVDKIISEIRHINTNFGIKIFPFQHDLFTASREKLHDFCKALIHADLGVTWGCSARIDTLDYETIKLLAESNCRRIYLGIETGSKRMQHIINKNINVDTVVTKVRYMKQNGIRVTCSFIYGFVDEEECDLLETLTLISELMLLDISNIQLHRLMLYPNTDELSKAYDKMYIDAENINCHVFENRYISHFLGDIALNKDLFSNFFEFDTDVRSLKWRNLPEYVTVFRLLHKFFRYIFDLANNTYGSAVEVYHAYSRTLNQKLKLLNCDNNHSLNLEEEYVTKMLEVIKKITDDLEQKTSNILLQTVYLFGEDMVAFGGNKRLSDIKTYEYNVVLLHKHGLSIYLNDVLESITVQFAKDEKGNSSFSRIA